MRDLGPLPALVGGTLVVAFLCMLFVSGGWLIWLPVLGALAMLAKAGGAVRR